ncbi:hypothetical protein PMI14_03140 [Acidovorax sp. CF316]|uniref:type II toxin-antitoxin system YafO family toxin n=1 Tax=Acidovorax sp. CF316 TaxID=1144317 RepID=UPI00026BD787|nr:type II toxin-antitoxin system YafO family toxin [Acidovorax sp. CF316]EJE52162.1 hypothetical protein PMI14_03140 [Acidovorax sp. CF316]
MLAALTALKVDPANFATEFDAWKASGEAGEFSNYLFGKDGAYIAPKVGGQANVLRHVHLVPLKDPDKLKKWNRTHRFEGRKSSDRALVYASDPTHGHLLILILEEPDAHVIVKMRTPETRTMMEKLAKVAEAFIHDGSIIL